MNRSFLYLAALFLGLFRITAHGIDYTFQLVTAPGYTHTWGYGIDNAGAIVFGAGSNEASFLRDSSGSLTQLIYPGHTPTVALGINNLGVIVGDAYNNPTSSYIGFIRATDGTFSNFTYPGAVGPNGGMQANDINDSGVTVGAFVVSAADSGAFIRLSTGQFQTFRYLDDPDTSAYGINNAGDITGQIFDGIPGQVSHQSSFLRHADGTFDPIAFPSSSETQAFGINNLGQVTGLYVNSGVHGFVRDSNGSFSTIDVPGAQNTQPWSINDSGQVVGTAMVSGRNYAFIATPVPEPTASVFLIIGTCFAVGRRARRPYSTQHQ